MKALLSFLILAVSSSYGHANLCSRYEGDYQKEMLIASLAQKLSYEVHELCLHPRILDIQFENRRFYNRERQVYETFVVQTLHYNEYSCSYFYNLSTKTWDSRRQSCYNTW